MINRVLVGRRDAFIPYMRTSNEDCRGTLVELGELARAKPRVMPKSQQADMIFVSPACALYECMGAWVRMRVRAGGAVYETVAGL